MKMEQGVPKRRHIKFGRRRIIHNGHVFLTPVYFKQTEWSDIWGSHGGTGKDSSLLGCDAV